MHVRQSRAAKLLTLSLAIALLVFSPCGLYAANIVFDIADDWSDTQNPNGVWSYNGAPGLPITTLQSDYDPTRTFFSGEQPAWAAAPFQLPGHVPFWAKSRGLALKPDSMPDLDFPSGRVGMHGSNTANSGVTWTSPVDGVVDISGGVWQMSKEGGHFFRSAQINLRLNGLLLTSVNVAWNDSFTSANPLDLSDGSGGEAAILNLPVKAGDVLTLEVVKTSSIATLVGVDLTITVLDPAIVLLQDLILDVAEINLARGINNAVDAKLDAAFAAITDANENNDVAACNVLNALVHFVEVQWDHGKLTDGQALFLIDAADEIILLLCPES